MQQKHILSTLILSFFTLVHILAQSEPPDFTKVNLIERQESPERTNNLNKPVPKDTNFTVAIANDFFYAQPNYFEIRFNQQNLSKDSILLTISFKNTSQNEIFVCLGSWIFENLIPKNLDIEVLDLINFGLDCFTNFKLESVQSQTALSQTFQIKKSEFESVNYNISLIHNIENFVNSMKGESLFKIGIYSDELLVDGVLNSDVLDYKGLTNIHIINFPLNNRENNVRILVEHNK